MAVVARLDEKYPGRIVLDSNYEDKPGIDSLLTAKWSAKDRVWHVPLAWSACIQLRNTFGDTLTVDPTLGAWAVKYIEEVVNPAEAMREMITLDDLEEPNHVTKQAIEIGSEIGLFKHQVAGAAFMGTTGVTGIFDETGTGKSAQTIAALRALHRSGDNNIFPALAVVPNSVKITWKREWQRWWPGLIVHLVDGSPAQRRKIFETPGHVYICNYEQTHRHSRLARFGNMELKRCVECGGLDEKISVLKCEVHQKEFNQIDFQTVICDEIHRMLHPSKQTRAVWSVSDKAVHRFALTGTPIQDNIEDLWFILRYMAPDEFPSKTRYLDRYADMGYNQWGIMQLQGIKPHMEAEFQKIKNSRVRRMLKDVVLPFLPPLIRERRYITMTGPQAKVYKQMAKEAMAELDAATGTLTALSPLSKATRLLQFASSYGQFVDGDGNPIAAPTLSDESELSFGEDDEPQFRLALPSNKITAFMEDVENGDFGESSVVVFSQSRQLLDLLAVEMTKKKIKFGMITGGQSTAERQQSIDDFQDKKIKYILVTIQAGGVGLTLTAADINVFLQRSYSSTAMKQALSRSHRIGAEIHDRITIIDYITENTIEEKQLESLEAKDGRIEEILKDAELLKKFLDPDKETM